MRWQELALMGIIALAEDKPLDVPGFVLFHICSISNDIKALDFPEWIYVKPSSIVLISNPKNLPDSCSAITSVSGRRIYVYGTYTEITRKLAEESRYEKRR